MLFVQTVYEFNLVLVLTCVFAKCVIYKYDIITYTYIIIIIIYDSTGNEENRTRTKALSSNAPLFIYLKKIHVRIGNIEKRFDKFKRYDGSYLNEIAWTLQ